MESISKTSKQPIEAGSCIKQRGMLSYAAFIFMLVTVVAGSSRYGAAAGISVLNSNNILNLIRYENETLTERLDSVKIRISELKKSINRNTYLLLDKLTPEICYGLIKAIAFYSLILIIIYKNNTIIKNSLWKLAVF